MLDHDFFLSYYGDDFTGSTDVMESLHFNGLPTALFLQPPTEAAVRAFRLKTTGQALRAFGLAGLSRAMAPKEMMAALPTPFEALSRIPTDFFHYKICSTFDSAPHVGNIGTATELALRAFPSDYVPLVVGAPVLNRFCVFGNLFARVGDITYRLDRHPTMAKHPTTPMQESDLRRHLARQSDRPVELLDMFALESSMDAQNHRLEGLISAQRPFVLFDTLNEVHLRATGRLLCQHKVPQGQLLVGSSGTEYALVAHLRATQQLPPAPALPEVAEAAQLIAVAGSCSPATAGQIQHVLELGYEGLRIQPAALLDAEGREQEMARLRQAALAALEEGRSVVLYSAMGPDDPSIGSFHEALHGSGMASANTNDIIGEAQGQLLKQLLEATDLKRVVVAGGDTSGKVAQALGIYALETLIPIAPGSPLCLAHAAHPRFDGLEISLKGGQVGNERYFESIRCGQKLP